MTKCATGGAVFGLAMSLLVACGGSAIGDGTSSGGAPGSSGGSGGSLAGGGAAHAGGTPGLDACSLPKQPGNCDAYAPSFWHNPTTGLCEPFVYGGCGGNDNRFATREACLSTCAGGGKDWVTVSGNRRSGPHTRCPRESRAGRRR